MPRAVAYGFQYVTFLGRVGPFLHKAVDSSQLPQVAVLRGHP